MTTGFPQGENLHFELAEGTSAAAGLLIPIYRQNGGRYHIGPNEQLRVEQLGLVSTAGGDCYFYADYAGGVAIASASTGADTFTIPGDVTHFLAVGSVFYVLGSTGNDAAYTVTAISYDLYTDRTTISVAAVADGTADGTLYWKTWAITAASAGSNTLTISGDQRKFFKVGRLFRVDGSTGNDNGGSNYTVTAVSYDSTAGTTTISVASVADGTADGYIVLIPTVFTGRKYVAGDYAANGGRELCIENQVELEAGLTLYGVAAAGNVDFDGQGFLKRNLNAAS